MWAIAINQFTNNLNEDEISDSDDSDHLEKRQPSKLAPLDPDSLFEAFHSRLFVDDCDLNVKIRTLNEIQAMFKIEKKALEALIGEDEKYKPVKK